MKFLVPVARVSLEDCERMAAVFARHRCDTRQAGQLYAAWRDASPRVRQRLLDQPELFFKAQPPAEPPPSTAGAAALLRDLDMATAILHRAQRRLAGRGGRRPGLPPTPSRSRADRTPPPATEPFGGAHPRGGRTRC